MYRFAADVVVFADADALIEADALYWMLLQPGSDLDELLAMGAVKARSRARTVLEQVRKAIGIG
ncbi:hypothetical protein [Streptomyces graminilatus]|uniref:hypothetical protein n=1 Tax=Streptomyces graminilatus TaxID=1464070 RepID=UPI0012FECFC1|nr:hypothetical protein [Streptomyces graminilatus]